MDLFNSLVMEHCHVVKGLDPVADFNAGTAGVTQAVALKLWHRVLFVIHKGVGTTGTSTITVEGCTSAAGAGATAVPFRYRATPTGDSAGAIQTATASGFATTAGSSQLYEIEVDADALISGGFKYVRLQCTEVVDSPVLGGILIMMFGPKYPGAAAPATVIT
ncbi:hypothetical protein [Schlesneria sp. T3-172]|uniref:hypothetical protein n=1 Tax=Schlesneria sphaerica TaxID=3373610 RepID=UPI0037C5EFB0